MTFLPYQLLNQQGIALKRFYTTVIAELTLEKFVSLTSNRVAQFWNRLPINYKIAQYIM